MKKHQGQDKERSVANTFRESGRRILLAVLMGGWLGNAAAQTPVPDSFNPGADGWVFALAIQADGEILAGGTFASVAGQPRNRIARLHAGGTLDTSFNPGANNDVYALAIQADGKILAGGGFTTLGGQPRNRIARLNGDGSLDSGFNPGASDIVYSLAVQADGKILVGGGFTALGGQPRNRIARLNGDGSLDSGFNPGASAFVLSLAVQADGKILVGGSFTNLGGQVRKYIGRLNEDGTLDSGFDPGANATVRGIAVQADGKILVGGSFTNLGGQVRKYIGRLNADGTLDSGFDPGAGDIVYSSAQQTDGKILVGGAFTTLGGQLRSRVARLNADGTLDAGFNPGAGGSYVCALALQSDGKLLVGGTFTTLGVASRSYIGRLNNTEPATDSLGYDGTTFAWLRGGTAPEVWRTTFAYTTNGVQWAMLDAGVRIPGGWELVAPGIATGAVIRARGHMATSSFGSTAAGIAETLRGPLMVTTQPAGRTNSAGATATFGVGAVGSTPIAYRWRKDGTNLADGGNVAGATAATVSVSSVLGGDAGAYDVVVSNTYGVVTSQVATLTVVDPVINTQPASRTNNAGTTATFSVAAVGSAPIAYQWRKNGTNLADGGNRTGTTNATMNVSAVLAADAGAYDVVVSNTYGVTTSQVAVLTVVDPAINTQPAGQMAQPGSNVTFTVTASGTGPLSYQWRKDGVALAGATNVSLTVTNAQVAYVGNYDVVVGGAYGSITSAVARLTLAASLDSGFNPGSDSSVNSLAVQPDKRILVGGAFTTMGGQPRKRIARLNEDGTVDSGFNPGASNTVWSLALQADGKILVGGAFTNLGGQARNYIGRLNADGTVDSGFNPGASNSVYSLAVQADGKILVGGAFTNLGGQTRNYIGRLNADGTVDSGFNPGANSGVYALAVQADGKILMGGYFTIVAGQQRMYIARLNADGTLDTGFNPAADTGVGALVAQADGKILVGGSFGNLGGQPRRDIARLNTDGTLDSAFNPAANAYVTTLAVQADGKILVGGAFTTLGGQTRNYIARLNTDGTADAGVNPGANNVVNTLVLQSDGKILVGGGFTTLGGQTRNRIGRLQNTDPATETLNYDGTKITWLRGGTVPEVWRTTFEHTTNGTQWTMLGAGTRISGGWELGGVDVTLGVIRARGQTAAGGLGNVTGGIVETMIGPPMAMILPASRTNDAGTTATFSATVLGSTAPCSYQWRKDGVNLADSGSITGATNAMFSVSSVLDADAGFYDVAVSNTHGVVTSQVAVLTVVDPAINTQPVGQVGRIGSNMTFTVTASGTGSLGYQWRKDGGALAGATNASLIVTNVQFESIGNYDVVIVGTYGSTTSAVARLTLVASLDSDFNPGASRDVYASALQADGKTLVGGLFTNLAGQTRNYIARLNADGTLDSGFNPGAYGPMYALAVQADGRILLGGAFTALAGQTRKYIARLNGDGTLDSGFNPVVNNAVESLAVQPDGKILLGGGFTNSCGETRNRIARLNADGTLDSEFNPGANNIVFSLCLQSDGKILVGGYFTNLAGQVRNYIGRLNGDGTLDAGFNPGANERVGTLVTQPDGKILAGGWFTTLGGQVRNRIARLNADGTVDAGFNPGADNNVFSLTMQADGKILAGGAFTTLGGQGRGRIGRLNMDGTVDANFNPGANNPVWTVLLQADEKILVGGAFTSLGGQTRNYIARLHNSDPATETLGYDEAKITWLRGGTAPEVWRTTFEYTTNGSQWAMLGAGTRISGGWELGGVDVALGVIRAQGHTAAGFDNVAGGIVETMIGPPIAMVLPASRTNDAGTTATFSATVLGSAAPCNYQWRKDGVNLADGGNLAGATAATFSVSAVLSGDAGGYDVVVSNAHGVATSQVAVLTVKEPAIGTQPASCTNNTGTTATFSVGAVGSAPIRYRWRKNGVDLADGGDIAGAAATTMSVSSVLPEDAGTYSVLVSNDAGSVLSADAVLTIVEVDSDTDGVPDWWVNQFFGHPTGVSNDLSRAGDDASGNGQNNLFKYVAGLDPTNPASVFWLMNDGGNGGETQNRLVFGPRWDSRTYTLMFRTSLVAGAWWTNVPFVTASDTGTVRTVTDLDADATNRFYRIRITSP